MKYKLTEKGKELLSYTGDLWTQHDFNDRAIIKETALELGLFEEVPERIELINYGCNRIIVMKTNIADDFTKAQKQVMEHAINGEWDQIPENLEFMIRMINDYGDGRLSRNNLVCFLREKINRL